MKRFLSVALVVALVVGAGVAFAQMGGGMMGGGMMGGGMMGGGMGGGMMGGGKGPGGQAGQSDCPGMAAEGQQAPTAPLTEEKAKELAQQYADQYLKGHQVDKILPFTGMHMTMYQVELKGPGGEVRVLHINPWGQVMPFGGPRRPAG